MSNEHQRNKKRVTHFKLQVSQDLIELVEGTLVKSSIKTRRNNTRFNDRYQFFKFYKSCDLDCDLAIDVFPHGNFG